MTTNPLEQPVDPGGDNPYLDDDQAVQDDGKDVD